MSARFRSKEDVTLYLFREWQKLTGNFTPRNVHRDLAYYNIGECDTQMLQSIRKQSRKFICINDANKPIDFDRTKHQLQEAFSHILPEKSSFEK